MELADDWAELLRAEAAEYAQVALTNIRREFPSGVYHDMTAPGDFPFRPRARTPVFYGSLDWHSCVEMHWLLVRLLRTAGDAVPAPEIQKVLRTQFSPVALAVGNFNGDAFLDLVVVNEGDDTASILLGNGDGTFTTGQLLGTGALPDLVRGEQVSGGGERPTVAGLGLPGDLVQPVTQQLPRDAPESFGPRPLELQPLHDRDEPACLVHETYGARERLLVAAAVRSRVKGSMAPDVGADRPEADSGPGRLSAS